MERKITVNVFIVIVAMILVVATIFSLIAYGLSEKYTRTVKTAMLKEALNAQIPLIRYTYDSGKAVYSVSSGFKHTFYSMTGVDTSDPIAMMTRTNAMYRYFWETIWNQPNPNPAPTPFASPIKSPDKSPDKSPVHSPAITAPSTGYPNGSIGSTGSGDKNTANPTPAPTPSKPSEPSKTPGTSFGTAVTETGENRYLYGTVAIRNGSGLHIDFEKILSQPLTARFKSSEEGAQILIYHTHTTECYIKDLSELNDGNENSWSSDNSKTVVRVGHELDTILGKEYGLNVIHNATVHNRDYKQSYNCSSVTVRSVLKGNPTVKLAIDVHRDGLSIGAGKLRVVQEVKGEMCAKLMFVVGTNENASNPNWENNLRLALTLARKLEEIAPGIMRYVSIRSSRYNQHIAENSLLVEFGGDGNTVDEVNASAKYLAQAIAEVMG